MSNTTDDTRPPQLSVAFLCREMAKSIQFYRDTLGFTLKECWPDEQKAQYASLSLHGQTIMLSSTGAEAGCGSEAVADFHTANAEAMEAATGGGVLVYIPVEDVDAYHQTISSGGAQPICEPETQFYGIRDFALQDPDGYRLIFYSRVTMTSCQSCAMPLKDSKPGDMYCQYCADENGKLRPYEAILEGTVTGFFMGMQKMERAAAEVAAREHLARQPAWKTHEPA